MKRFLTTVMVLSALAFAPVWSETGYVAPPGGPGGPECQLPDGHTQPGGLDFPTLLGVPADEDEYFQADERGSYTISNDASGMTQRERRAKGYRFFKGRWVRWIVGRIDREDPRQGDNWSELLDEAREQVLDALAEAADVVPTVNAVKTALEQGLSGDGRDVWVTYLLVDDSGKVVAEEVVQLTEANDTVPFYSPRMPESARQERLNRQGQRLNQRMARGWDPTVH
ncbi:MAG: hypothetical protein HY319_14095 [Armatimonadetes bacterium]|nr:hypothetical protein [Armatimonadota bacterium]